MTAPYAVLAQGAADVERWLSFEKVTVVGLLLVIGGLTIYGLMKEKQWWVPGWLYRREVANAEKWEKAAVVAWEALRTEKQTANTALRVMEKAAGPAQ